MRKIASLLILVLSGFFLIGQGCDGGPAQSPEEKKFEPFSFAIITDVHVGRGFPDYGAEGWADYDLSNGQAKNGKEGEFNWVTDRLVATVNWLNKNYQKENIKFLVILGDISDSAEMSEFFRAKKILDNLEIPYIPLIGNHDVWSHLNEEDGIPCDKIEADGELYFERIFWRDQHNKKNIASLKELFGNSWQKQRVVTKPIHLLQNYAFSYQGINFVALDYARRDTNCRASFAQLFTETKEWYKENLERHKNEVILIASHYPLITRGGFTALERESLARLAFNKGVSLLNFAGHIHNFQNINDSFHTDTKLPVIVTKGLMGKTGELQEKEDADFLRIVKVKGPKIEDIDYSTIVTISVGGPAPTTVIPPPPAACPPEGEAKFSQGQNIITTDALKVRENPGINSPEIKTQPKGTSGKILEGPVCADNYVWWKVEYEDGTIGWSAENWLEKKPQVFPEEAPSVIDLCPLAQTVLNVGQPAKEEVDLNSDGITEILMIELEDIGQKTIVKFTLKTLDPLTGTYEIALQEIYPFSQLPETAGPWASIWHGDLTRDGKEEAVLCFGQWGANDLFKRLLIFGYQEDLPTLLFKTRIGNAEIEFIESKIVIHQMWNFYGGACICRQTSYFMWIDNQFNLINWESQIQGECQPRDCTFIDPRE